MRHALFALALLALPAAAEEFAVGDLQVTDPYAIATPPGAPVGGGYVTIRNDGASDDRLLSISVSADLAGKVELHEMRMEGDVMRMAPLADGVQIPAGGEAVLEPGGMHVMFMDLGAPLPAGTSFPATLTFQNAGAVDVLFEVIRRGETPGGHGMDHSGG